MCSKHPGNRRDQEQWPSLYMYKLSVIYHNASQRFISHLTAPLKTLNAAASCSGGRRRRPLSLMAASLKNATALKPAPRPRQTISQERGRHLTSDLTFSGSAPTTSLPNGSGKRQKVRGGRPEGGGRESPSHCPLTDRISLYTHMYSVYIYIFIYNMFEMCVQ